MSQGGFPLAHFVTEETTFCQTCRATAHRKRGGVAKGDLDVIGI